MGVAWIRTETSIYSSQIRIMTIYVIRANIISKYMRHVINQQGALYFMVAPCNTAVFVVVNGQTQLMDRIRNAQIVNLLSDNLGCALRLISYLNLNRHVAGVEAGTTHGMTADINDIFFDIIRRATSVSLSSERAFTATAVKLLFLRLETKLTCSRHHTTCRLCRRQTSRVHSSSVSKAVTQ